MITVEWATIKDTVETTHSPRTFGTQEEATAFYDGLTDDDVIWKEWRYENGDVGESWDIDEDNE